MFVKKIKKQCLKVFICLCSLCVMYMPHAKVFADENEQNATIMISVAVDDQLLQESKENIAITIQLTNKETQEEYKTISLQLKNGYQVQESVAPGAYFAQCTSSAGECYSITTYINAESGTTTQMNILCGTSSFIEKYRKLTSAVGDDGAMLYGPLKEEEAEAICNSFGLICSMPFSFIDNSLPNEERIKVTTKNYEDYVRVNGKIGKNMSYAEYYGIDELEYGNASEEKRQELLQVHNSANSEKATRTTETITVTPATTTEENNAETVEENKKTGRGKVMLLAVTAAACILLGAQILRKKTRNTDEYDGDS